MNQAHARVRDIGDSVVEIIGECLGGGFQTLLGDVGINVEKSRNDGLSLGLNYPGPCRIIALPLAKDP